MENQKRLISRRDFLKLASLLPLTAFSKPIESLLARQRFSDDLPGVIVLIFDAWSAKNMKLYGYPLQTMPNVERGYTHGPIALLPWALAAWQRNMSIIRFFPFSMIHTGHLGIHKINIPIVFYINSVKM